jgi:tetratricopeptide (TPR) repeat protein
VLGLDRNNKLAREKVEYYKKYISTVVESRFQTAKQLLDKKEYSVSIDVFKEILAMDPTHQASKNYLRQAQAGLKKYLDTHFKLAQAYYGQSKWNEASDECNVVLSLDNNHEPAKSLQLEISNHLSLKHLHEKALRFYQSKNYRRALETFHQILAREPGDKTAKEYVRICEKENLAQIEELFNRGMVNYSEGDYQEAIKVWSSILDLDPNHKSSLEYIQKATERLKILSDIK